MICFFVCFKHTIKQHKKRNSFFTVCIKYFFILGYSLFHQFLFEIKYFRLEEIERETENPNSFSYNYNKYKTDKRLHIKYKRTTTGCMSRFLFNLYQNYDEKIEPYSAYVMLVSMRVCDPRRCI